jgi:hypothetical protein
MQTGKIHGGAAVSRPSENNIENGCEDETYLYCYSWASRNGPVPDGAAKNMTVLGFKRHRSSERSKKK